MTCSAPHQSGEFKRQKALAEGEERGFHVGKRVKDRSGHVALDGQGTLLGASAAIEIGGRRSEWFRAMTLWSSPSVDQFRQLASNETAQPALREGKSRSPPAVQRKRCSSAGRTTSSTCSRRKIDMPRG
jgi:hypothetical protein